MTFPLYGIFGGTFDPVHNGHIETVSSVLKSCGLAGVIFVPTAVPPHRHRPAASARHRVEMVHLAIAGIAEFDLDDRETRRDSFSYTYDTLASLKADFPTRKYCLILGMDAFLELESWYRWNDLVAAVHFIVMCRPGWCRPARVPRWWNEGEIVSSHEFEPYHAGKILLVDVPPNPVSATEIRYGISRGIDVSPLVAEPVWEYICKNKLYTPVNLSDPT
ncbi:MAG: nicotinate-nucleotide adenylyltransferase [Gammaproteobacteria bacterium]|nr:nicotinate-nucleotide adenylyltransferase [Gammaproteobacteria bacterium]